MTKKSKALLCLTSFFIIASLLPVIAFSYIVIDPPVGPPNGFYVTSKSGSGWIVVSGDYTYTNINDGNYYKVQSVWWYFSGAHITLEFDYASWWNLEYLFIDVWSSDGQPQLYIKYVNEVWTTVQITLQNGYNVINLPSNKLVEAIRITVPYLNSLKIDYAGIYYT